MACRFGRCGAAVVLLVTLIAVVGCGGHKSAASPQETTTSAAKTKTSYPHLAKLPAAQPGQHSRIAKYRIGSYKDMNQFLTLVLNRVDGYWTQIFRNSNLPDPTVTYDWLAPGQSTRSKCSSRATTDQTAAYCSLDDTIYISQKIAADLWKGLLGKRHARVHPGAFGVAYVVAHEYGHNVQAELGIAPTHPTVMQLELQADCLAGVFGNSEYYAGVLDPGDVRRAIALANLGGDYDYKDPGHHGTPAQRVAAWKTGYNSGAPDTCLSTFSP